MSESLAVGGAVARPGADAARAGEQVLDPRRKLQLALAVSWLLDGVLQYQPSMFSHGFPKILEGASSGNPAVIASPINWSATLLAHHLVALNAIFATIQLALGLGIAWRPTVKLALGASVLWALAVWWLGEGFGGILAGSASPIDGAPGAVILYALLAVLLWPADRDRAAPFVAGRAVGRGVARGYGWCCGRAWRSSPCSPRHGRRGRSAARSRTWRPGSPAGWPGSTTMPRAPWAARAWLPRSCSRSRWSSWLPVPTCPRAWRGRPWCWPLSWPSSSGSPKDWAACSRAVPPIPNRARYSPC